MKNNGYRDYLLHIRKQTKNEKNKLRIDFIIRTIDNIGLDKIDDITTENDKVTILCELPINKLIGFLVR